MKKLVTTLTASALLMGSLATAVSAAETSATVTDATYTSPTTGTVVTGTTKFVGNNKAFSFTNPTAWDERVSSQEYTGTALTEMGETAANYMVNFTYKPTDSNATPVVFATIRGYDSSVWNGLTNKEMLGTPLNTTGGTIYVLSKVASNPFPATSAADQNAFNELLQSTNGGALQGFMVNPATGTLPSGPVVSTDDPAKVSVNPTPNIQLTSMTPFYKSPGGTMIGYLGPQKLDTTGNGQTDPASGQWVEIYTWMGLAWIVVE